jgi:hypothetical protein
MAKPKNFEYAFFKKNAPKDLAVDPKMATYMGFLHEHYIHYPKLNPNSKDAKVMRDRVNMIRQMTVGLKKTTEAVKGASKNCKGPKHDPFKAILDDYLELLRTAERDRQNWIKIERGVGNTANLNEMVINPGLDDPVRV